MPESYLASCLEPMTGAAEGAAPGAGAAEGSARDTRRAATVMTGPPLIPDSAAERATLAAALKRAAAILAGPVRAPVARIAPEKLAALFAPRQLSVILAPLM